MKLSRRSMFGFLAVAPVAGIAAAKELAIPPVLIDPPLKAIDTMLRPRGVEWFDAERYGPLNARLGYEVVRDGDEFMWRQTA